MATKGQNRSIAELRAQIDEVDAQIAVLFEKRMALAREIAGLKKAEGLPIEDPEREEQIIAANSLRIADPQIREQYIRMEKTLIEISKQIQGEELLED